MIISRACVGLLRLRLARAAGWGWGWDPPELTPYQWATLAKQGLGRESDVAGIDACLIGCDRLILTDSDHIQPPLLFSTYTTPIEIEHAT